MSDFLEKLKSGMQEAQQKFAMTQQRFVAVQAESQAVAQRLAVAQTEYQAATMEFQAFQTLVNAQTRKEQVAGTPVAVSVVRVAAPAPAALPANGTASHNVVPSPSATGGNKSDGSKTQAVRDVLRQHPAGMTPSEVWAQLETKMVNRAYLYAVLKRLRDKGDAKERRGKYFLTSKIAEDQNQEIVQ
jgi:hypothetical protein